MCSKRLPETGNLSAPAYLGGPRAARQCSCPRLALSHTNDSACRACQVTTQLAKAAGTTQPIKREGSRPTSPHALPQGSTAKAGKSVAALKPDGTCAAQPAATVVMQVMPSSHQIGLHCLRYYLRPARSRVCMPSQQRPCGMASLARHPQLRQEPTMTRIEYNTSVLNRCAPCLFLAGLREAG